MMATASRIQRPSSCHCQPDDISTCYLNNATDYKAYQQLSDETTSLSLVIKGSLREDLTDFSSLGMLENWKLLADKKYSSYNEGVLYDALDTFKRRDLVKNLTYLKTLSISLVLKTFYPALLTPLRQLRTLSFSYTYMLDFNDFIDIVKVTGTHLLRVEEFRRMIAFQRIITPGAIIRLKEHIYERLQNLTLKVLDLSNNKAVLLQQGLPTYLPFLEVFRVDASELMIFENNQFSPICSLAGVVMHANIREFELSFPKKTTVEDTDSAGYISYNTGSKADRLLYCIQHLNIKNDLCDLGNCICEGLTKLPCQNYSKEIPPGTHMGPHSSATKRSAIGRMCSATTIIGDVYF